MAKILLVNDTTHILQLMKQTLRKEPDLEIIEAYDGKMALEKIDEESPDIVVLDAIMPEIDGFDVCQQLRQNEETKYIPIIFFSSVQDDDEHDDVERGLESGANAYLTEIFKPNHLLLQIRSILMMIEPIHDLRLENRQLKKKVTSHQKNIDHVYTEVEQYTHKITDILNRYTNSLSKLEREQFSKISEHLKHYFENIPETLAKLEPQRETVLIVDDEDLVRQMLNLKLKRSGFVVIQAENGTEALKIIEEHQIDVIICDAMMPELDGFGLTRYVKETLKKDIPVLLITAKFSNNVLDQEKQRWKFDDFLTKPFDLDELVEKIRKLLKKKDEK